VFCFSSLPELTAWTGRSGKSSDQPFRAVFGHGHPVRGRTHLSKQMMDQLVTAWEAVELLIYKWSSESNHLSAYPFPPEDSSFASKLIQGGHQLVKADQKGFPWLFVTSQYCLAIPLKLEASLLINKYLSLPLTILDTLIQQIKNGRSTWRRLGVNSRYITQKFCVGCLKMNLPI
jgi:hypothetical protein